MSASVSLIAATASDCGITPPPANWDNIPHDDHARLNAVFHHWYSLHGKPFTTEVVLRDDGNYCVQMFPQNLRCTAAMLRAVEELAPNISHACYNPAAVGSKAHARGAVEVYVNSTMWERLNTSTASAAANSTEVPPPPPPGAASYTAQLLTKNRSAFAAVLAAAQDAAPKM